MKYISIISLLSFACCPQKSRMTCLLSDLAEMIAQTHNLRYWLFLSLGLLCLVPNLAAQTDHDGFDRQVLAIVLSTR